MPAPSPLPDHRFRATLTLASEAGTRALAAALGAVLGPGDVALLDGPIGAGKTAFARALIQSRLADAGAQVEDVPSPTFTLVQLYDAGGLPIWHADLYRLTSAAEIDELGLEDAFETALCLVEWPDRLGALTPRDALRIDLAPGRGETERAVTLSGAAGWSDRLAPVLAGFHD